MAALWYLGVTAKQSELAATRRKSADMRQKLHEAEALMRREDEISGTLQSRSELLARREAGLAPDRDAYAWLINTVNAFIQSRKGVNIDTYSQPEISDVGIIPRFPYRWATFHLKGTGYYHDFGKFFADFENAFPYFRIQNLNLSANSGTGPGSGKTECHLRPCRACRQQRPGHKMSLSTICYRGAQVPALCGLFLAFLIAAGCGPKSPPPAPPKPKTEAPKTNAVAVAQTNLSDEYASVFENLPPQKGKDPFFPSSHRRNPAPEAVPGANAHVDAALVLKAVIRTSKHSQAVINNEIFEAGEEQSVPRPQRPCAGPVHRNRRQLCADPGGGGS